MFCVLSYAQVIFNLKIIISVMIFVAHLFIGMNYIITIHYTCSSVIVNIFFSMGVVF